MEEDLYALLELTPSCTTDEIKRQYKKLALQYHPDRHQTASDSQRTHFEKKFKEVARAYEVLSDPAARRQYDALRSNPPQQQQEDYSYPSSHHPYTRDSRSSTRTNSSNNNGGASGWRDDDPFHPFGFEQRSTPHQTPPVAGGGGYGRHRSPFASFFDDFVFRDPFAIFNEMFQSTMHPSMASHHRRDVVDDGGVPFGFGMMKHMMMGNHLLAADPFAMFHDGGGGFGFHENDDPFPSMFSSVDKRRTQRQHPFAGLLMGGDGDPFSMFGSSSSAMPGGGMKMMSYSSSTMTTTMGRGAEESGVQRQTTTTTTTVGPTGQRVTKTVRTVQRPNGLVTEDVEEEVAQPPQQQQRRYAPLLPPSRAALPPPTHRSSESRDPQPQQQPQQQQQSPPPLRRAPSSQQQRYHSLPPAASRAAPPTALPYHPHHHHQPVPSSSSPSLPISHQRLPQRATVTHY